MADANYKRLTCRACTLDFTFEVRAGRPPVECVACKSKQAATVKPTHCQHCSNPIASPRGGKRFCSKTCLYRERDGSKLTRAQYREKCRAEAKHSFTCVCCGAAAYRKLSGTNASKGYENKYCSMACRGVVRDRVQREVEFLRGLNKPKPVVSTLPALRALAKAIARLASWKAKACKSCVVCGVEVGYAYGRAKTYCSAACRKKAPGNVAAKKAYKSKRKALKRGANGGEAINPVVVFQAAGWKCQLCGKPTPQRLRGTTHKRAPELDHVRPISKGGTHTWGNVQCLCRECNGWKSDRVVVGQIGLFTAMV